MTLRAMRIQQGPHISFKILPPADYRQDQPYGESRHFPLEFIIQTCP